MEAYFVDGLTCNEKETDVSLKHAYCLGKHTCTGGLGNTVMGS